MKTITRKLVSTMPETYGQVLQEQSFEVPDDYEDRDHKEEKLNIQTTVYYVSADVNASQLPFVTALAVISVIVSLICLTINL